MVDLSALQTPGPQAFWLLATAGFLDGVNPCAFSTLLVFVGALLAYVGASVRSGDVTAARRAVLGVGLAYAAGMFLVYFTAGLGLFGIARLIPAMAVPWVVRVSGVVVILMGLLMTREYFVPDSFIRIGMPRSLHHLVRRYAHATSVGTALAAGAVIGLCSVPCSGAVYLGVVSLLATFGWGQGLLLLFVYNLAFIAPVILLLLTISSRMSLLRFTHWYLNYRQVTKLIMGLFVVALGFLVLLAA